MPDREKVIKGLECCAQDALTNVDVAVGFTEICEKCPYWGDRNKPEAECAQLAREALELLKEQHGIIRCKDCDQTYFCLHPEPIGRTLACKHLGIDVKPDWFCADGGRAVKGND